MYCATMRKHRGCRKALQNIYQAGNATGPLEAPQGAPDPSTSTATRLIRRRCNALYNESVGAAMRPKHPKLAPTRDAWRHREVLQIPQEAPQHTGSEGAVLESAGTARQP